MYLKHCIARCLRVRHQGCAPVLLQYPQVPCKAGQVSKCARSSPSSNKTPRREIAEACMYCQAWLITGSRDSIKIHRAESPARLTVSCRTVPNHASPLRSQERVPAQQTGARHWGAPLLCLGTSGSLPVRTATSGDGLCSIGGCGRGRRSCRCGGCRRGCRRGLGGRGSCRRRGARRCRLALMSSTQSQALLHTQLVAGDSTTTNSQCVGEVQPLSGCCKSRAGRAPASCGRPAPG